MEFDPSKLAEMMGKAQSMQQKMQEDLSQQKVEGQAGGGMVKVTLNGSLSCETVHIEEAVVDKADVSMLEDLVCAAVNDAVKRVEELRAEQVKGMMGGMGMPEGLF